MAPAVARAGGVADDWTMHQPPQIAGGTDDTPQTPAVLGLGGRQPDPGTRKAALIAWLVLLVVLPIVVAFQQTQAHAVPEREADKIMPPQGDQVEVSTRLGTRAGYAIDGLGEGFLPQVDGAIEAADSPLQRFRGAIAAGELKSPNEAAKRLGRVIETLETNPDEFYPPKEEGAEVRRDQLMADARTLLPYYEALADDMHSVEGLDDETLNGLVERHGFFGELVRVARLPKEHELREQLLDGAIYPLIVMSLLIVVILCAIVAAFVLGILAIVFAGMGRIRFAMPRPAPGGSVYLESAVVFVVGFAVLQLVQALAAMVGETAQMIAAMAALPAQWLLLLAPFWPLVRGVSLGQIRDDLGLRAPKGVLIEIVMGLAGYLALLPLMLAGVAVMLVLTALLELVFPSDPDAMGPSNPILQMIETLNPFMLVVLFTLATIWAPLCEEMIFRGALFRHLRGRLVVPLAAMLSAMVFGMMHGYALIQLIPVTVLGFNFALIRAWRGSLVGPIAAHAINNAVVLSLLYSLGFTLYG